MGGCFSFMLAGCTMMYDIPEPDEVVKQSPISSSGSIEHKEPHLLIIFDSSESMKEEDDLGDIKLDAAKKTIRQIADKFPAGSTHVSLVEYQGCDTPPGLMLPISNIDTSKVKEQVERIEARGDSPIAMSLLFAAQELIRQAGGGTIILVSDGTDSCGGDPCRIARRIRQNDNVNLRIHTIGYGAEGAARDELDCVAKSGGGIHFDAKDSLLLARFLHRVIQSEVTRGYDEDFDGVLNEQDKCADTPMDFSVDGSGCGVNYTFQIHFDTGSDKIRAEFGDNVRTFAEYLLQNGYSAELGGHTDSTGAERHNEQLSKQRAESVMRALISNGVPASRLTAIGYGSTRAIGSNDTLSGRYENRRVEARIIK
uniref:von Willebrand factor type A domain-containing protein n=1 Tax=Candidatus Kentrum sp. DK TaxID=2126562 RepID=A0A450T2H0_9GAMM|nr:MAG: von Willebrand factor type A domain-containing protein [Candidatus Kentron sp. DK]